MMNKILIMAIVLLCFASEQSTAQPIAQYEKKIWSTQSDTLLYRVLYPENFSINKKYPVILFLHGSGERGNDNERQLTHGSKLFLDQEVRRQFPAIVIFPQCPATERWTERTKETAPDGQVIMNFQVNATPPRPANMVNLLIEDWMKASFVDQKRIYIMGLSMGGIATLEFLHRWPEKYAAAAVICGGHEADFTANYSHIPIWFFHGEADDVVPPRYSKQVYDKVKEGNRKTRYTSYPNTNHNSWDKAFAEPELLKWIFNNKKHKQ